MKWTWPGRIAVIFGAIILARILLMIWVPVEYLYIDEYHIYRTGWYDILSKAALTSVIGIFGCWVCALIQYEKKNKS